MPVQNAGSFPALVDSVAGLSAGAASTIVVHPLDVIKTRLQIHRSHADATVMTSLKLFRSLTSHERPFLSLYRGLMPNLLGNASSWALFFYFKTYFETQLRRIRGYESFASYSHIDELNHIRRQPLKSLDYFIASGLSGLAVSVATNPIWVLKTRMLSSERAATGAYPSMLAGSRSIWRHEGWTGFYRGLGINCIGVFHGAIQFAAYETLKQRWHRYKVESLEEGGSQDLLLLETGATLVISGLAKVFAGTVMYPQQVIRSRLQTYDADERFGRSIREAIRRVYSEEGMKGFYRGLGPNILRVLPSTWITFLVYENGETGLEGHRRTA